MKVRLSLFTGIVLLSVSSYAQSPVTWTYSSKQISSNVFEVHMLAKIESGWHIYAQHQPKTAIAVPTSISITKSPIFSLQGNIMEKGQIIHYQNEEIGIAQDQYANSVEFVQIVRFKAPVRTDIAGMITYQVCTDKECLPSVTIRFNVQIQPSEPTK